MLGDLKSFINNFQLYKYRKKEMMKKITVKKRGAIELSMTTVVVIVLAMTMLALGLTLVRTLFQGAIYTASSLNTQVQAKLNAMFQEEGKTVGIVSENGRIEPARGVDNCVWWSILAPTSGTYSYSFKVSPEECAGPGYGLSETEIKSWFVGMTGSYKLSPNEKKTTCLPLNPSKTAPSCLFNLILEVTSAGRTTSDSAWVRPKAATLFG